MASKKNTFVSLDHVIATGGWKYSGRTERANEIFIILINRLNKLT